MDSIDIQPLISEYLIPWSINIGLALAIFIVGRWVIRLVLSGVVRLMQRMQIEPMLVGFTRSILHVALLLFVVIAALDQLGVDTTSFIALFGAAGLAVGMAMKDSLGHFASGVLMLMLKPFKVGDFIEAAGTSGTVENIGIFATTLKTGDNREIIVPNGSIFGNTITNYSARETRRIDMVFGIGYDDDLRQAKEIVQSILDADERVLKDPEPLVVIGELADSSVNLYVRPWVNSSDYWSLYYDLNEKIKLAFDKAGISIPYPQMDVHLTGTPLN